MSDESQVISSTAIEHQGVGGVRLIGARWLPEAAPRGVVVIAHGLDEHIGRYLHVVAALVSSGYAVYAHDHRGHGRSGGERGVIARFDEYVDDLALLVETARREQSGLPLTLLGHSMGGLIAVRYALQHQAKLAALILSGAALLVGQELPWWKKQMLLVLGRFQPNRTLPVAEENLLSRDPEVDRRFKSDPLCNSEPTRLGFARELYLAAADARRRVDSLALPMLIMHGAADRLTSPEGSKLIYDKAVSNDKTLKLWPDDLHEIFNELDQREVIGFVVEWMLSR
jgi:lysophospholipase